MAVTISAMLTGFRIVGGATRRRPPATPAAVETTTMITAPPTVDRPKERNSMSWGET